MLKLALALLSFSAATVAAQQPDPTLQLLQRLADAPGPPGAEDAVRAIMVERMKPLTTAPLRYDGMGSVIAQLGNSGPRVMVDAHMDELGGMVRRIAPNGQLSMQMLGGWLDQALVDQRWDGDTLHFTVTALGQSVISRLDVLDSHVHAEIDLPPLLRLFGGKIRDKLLSAAPKLLK